MPPKVGMAIGSMRSAPRPLAVSTGISAKIVVAAVIRQGRMRRTPAASAARRIASTVSGFCSRKSWRKYVATITPLSEAMPNSARKPTHTATLKFSGRT